MNHPLRDAFLSTTYRVCLEGKWIATRIGTPSRALADWLRGRGCTRASLISACNPRGAQQSPLANAARAAALRLELAEKGWSVCLAEGVSADRRWREPSLLVPGLYGSRCRDIMQGFDQLAWVEYDAAGLARLCWACNFVPGD